MNVVFGPVSSRRFGVSLGIDLSPKGKCCNFDCVYCELSAAKPKNQIDEPPDVASVLKQVSAAILLYPHTEVITLTANGEPTLYTRLDELIAGLNLIKNGRKTLILSNGTGVMRSEIRNALLGLDIVKFSLDSAVQRTFGRIDRGGKEILVSDLISAMANFRREFTGELVLEVLVVAGMNDSKAEFDALNLAIKEIAPSRVDISTIDRPPAYPVKGVNLETLNELAANITGVPCVIASAKYGDEKLNFSKDELLNLLTRRPQSQNDVDNSFSEISKENLNELLAAGKIYKTKVAGLEFYRVRL